MGIIDKTIKRQNRYISIDMIMKRAKGQLKMHGIILPGNERAISKEFSDPELGDDEVVIRIKCAQICASDLSLYHGWALVGGVSPGTYIAGHHQAGVVEKVGKGVRELRNGDRVSAWVFVGCGQCKYCRSGWYQFCKEVRFLGFTMHGGFAELLAVPARSCMNLPEKMDVTTGAFAEPLATLYNAAKTLGISGENNVLITGLGPMGIAGLLMSKAFGAKVSCVEPLDDRLQLAKNLGASRIINPNKENPLEIISELTDGEGVDMAIECSGNANGLNTALNCARKFGKVAIVGECLEAKVKPSEQFIRKRLTVYGVWNFNINEWDNVAKTVINNAINMEKVVTHRFKLEEADKGFETFDKKQGIVCFYP